MLAMSADWINAFAALGAVAIAAWALYRSTHREDTTDLDRRIDERIALKVGIDIAVIKNTLNTIQSTLASSSQRDAALVKATVDATAGAIREQLLHDREART